MLDSAFGSVESAKDLYFPFRLIQQKAGEKMSDYIRKLEPFLAKVVKKGGISPVRNHRGDNGHFASKCSSAENEKRVIRRLIASLNKARDRHVLDDGLKS